MQDITHHPFSLIISPGLVAAQAGVHNVSVPVEAVNVGTAPMRVVAVYREMGRPASGHCTIGQGSAEHWATISPASFTLAPGQSRALRLTVRAPAGARGVHDVTVLLNGTLQSQAQTGKGASGHVS